jgi:hypothetical protein
MVMTVAPLLGPAAGVIEDTVGAAATVRLKVAVAVAPLASVTVTVYVAAVLATAGVPAMAPVLALNVRPAGSDGETP